MPAEPCHTVGLPVSVEKRQRVVLKHGQEGDMHGKGCLADAAFVVENGNLHCFLWFDE